MDEAQIDSLTKKERNERDRAESKKSQEQVVRAKKIKSLIPWVVLAVLIAGGIYWAMTTTQKSNEARPGESVSIVSQEHVALGEPHEGYNSNPPTSGPHAGPAPWGFSEQEIADENAVHNLEHGGIWISYKNLEPDQIDELKAVAQSNRLSVIVSPRASNDAPIAVASWGRLLTMETVDVDQITDFIKANKNKSPEPLAR